MMRRALQQVVRRQGLGGPAASRCTAETVESNVTVGYHSSAVSRAEKTDDVVMSAFKKQQSRYTELMKGLSKIEVPLEGDEKAVKAYATEVEKLKKKVGMPDYESLVKAEMAYAMSVAGNDVKKFVSSVLGDMDVSKTAYEGIGQDVMDAIQEAEKASGKELDASNEKGWKALGSKIAAIEKKYGLQDTAKVKDDAVLDMYMKHVTGLRETVEDQIDKVVKAEDIQVGKVDLKGLKPEVA